MLKPARVLAWLLLAALAFVTIAPIGYRPVSGQSVSLERFGAFALLGFLFALGYPRHRLWVAAGTVTAAGALEIAQMVQLSRHGRPEDFLVKAAGCAAGVLLALGLRALRGRAVGARDGAARP